MKKSYLTKKSLPQQYLAIKTIFPEAKIYFWKKKMIIHLLLQPTELSKKYHTEFILENYGKCEVWIHGDLKKLDDPNFPHKYHIDQEKRKAKICLYHPEKDEWNSKLWLKDTLIPWAIEWLLFYELWLATGNWLGGGEHPSLQDSQNS